MSRLAFAGRPWVVFNEQDKQHRKWYADFVRNGTWGKCPVRFIVSDDHGDLLTMIQRKLNKFYTEKEFGRISS